MSSNYTYHRIIRKIIVAFGDLFNEINIARYDSHGVEKEHFLVPIVYGGKEKYVSRLEGDPELDKKVQVSLPIMSYEMIDMNYDSARKLNTNFRNIASAAGDTTNAVYNPVPFDFEFTLFAYVRNMEDGAQLMEKILPYFTPDYTINVNLIPEMGIIKQLPIILKSVTNEVDYEGDYNTKVRNIIWTLNFTVKGYLYGSVSQAKIIRRSITNVLTESSMGHSDIIATMGGSGLGDYTVSEEVYQGYSYENATATASVKDWDPVGKKLKLGDITGHFVSGEKITGLSTHAIWSADSLDVDTGLLFRTEVVPYPTNVILPNDYIYLVKTTEYPPIEVGAFVTMDTTVYEFSQTYITFDIG